MDVHKLAGWCLILFGVINVLHEVAVRASARHTPGTAYALITALLFTFGARLLWVRKDGDRNAR